MKKILNIRHFEIAIHVLHIIWIVLLWQSLNSKAELNANPALFIAWSAAMIAEMIRWDIVGREVVEINGSYSYGRAIEIANDKLFSMSWYLIPPTPSTKTVKETADLLFIEKTRLQLRTVIANYYFDRTSLAAGGIGIFLFFHSIAHPTPPTFGGLLRNYYVSVVFWYACFACMGRILFVFLYVLYIRLRGVK